jgi:hypothetical protein
MQRRDLEGAAAKYSYLRGLFFVPLGGLSVLAALGNWAVGPLRHPWAFLVVAGLLAAACLPINRYYNEHYGRISPSTRQQVRGSIAGTIALAVMVGGSLLMRSRAPWSLDLPVNAIAVSFAVILLVSYAITVGLHAHHVIVGGTLLVVGALPVWNGPDPSNVGLVLAGVAIAIVGVFDHRLLVRTFGPPEGVRLEERDVGA